MSWRDLFTSRNQAERYSKYRPTYDRSVYSKISDYLNEKRPGPHVQAIDVGCGSGQFTFPLASYFDRVLGVDISEAQIERANATNKYTNTAFRVGSFNNLYLADESTDLVTVATAVHWFKPIEDFYREVDRILKPGGVLALTTNRPPIVSIDGQHSQQISEGIIKFREDPRISVYSKGQAHLLYNNFEGLTLPYDDYLRVPDLVSKTESTFGELLGMMSSYSFYAKFKQNSPHERDPLDEFRQSLRTYIGPDQTLEEYRCTLRYPTYLAMCRKPL